MVSLFRFAAVLGLVSSVTAGAGAQGERCSRDALAVDGISVQAKFCAPATAPAASVSVVETFSAGTKTLSRTVALTIVTGAAVSRIIDDVDLAPIGVKRSLHMTLAYHAGLVELEHALALPGAMPVK